MDTVFIRQLRLPAWIGLYRHEKIAPQTIEIDLEVDLPGNAVFKTGKVSDTIDYGVVVRGEMTLELDDGKIVHLRQGDCIVQNGTRHRWRNALEGEPCLMAFVSIGAKRSVK